MSLLRFSEVNKLLAENINIIESSVASVMGRHFLFRSCSFCQPLLGVNFLIDALI